jgi:hypothetical protein
MAIRVSRQGVEILYLPDPTIRASRQMANVLYKEVGEIRVSRQHIEVLRPAPQVYEKSASSTLTFIQTAARDALTFERSASSSLSLGGIASVQGVLNLFATSTLVLGQDVVYSPKALNAFSVLVLVQETAFPGTHLLSATSTLELEDSAVNSGLITVSASSTLDFIQYADEETKARDVTSVLSLTDTASVDKILQGFSTLELTQSARTTKELLAESQLTLTQSARQGVQKLYATSQFEFAQSTYTNLKSLYASSTLSLSGSNIITKPIRVSATSELTTFEDVWNGIELVLEATGLRDEATVITDQNYSASSVIPIQHEASAHVAFATGISCAASSTITFNQRAIPEAIEESVTSTLVFTQTAVADAAKPGRSTLSLTQTGAATINRGTEATSTLDLHQSVTYTLIIGNTKCQYSPFVGDNSDPDVPDPPPAEIDGPMVGIQVPFQLVYPSTGVVSDSVALKTPNLGNKDRLSFQRVIREARGGTLIVYADPIWPKTQTLALTFTGLLRVEAQELLTFIDDHLGLEIGLIDWEHRYWRGVVTKPDEPVIEDKFDKFTVNFEFEGELDPLWNPQVVPPALRYSATRSAQQDGYYVPNEPTIPVTPEVLDYYDAEADSTIIIGNPLYIVSGTGHVDLAQADASATAQVAGLSITDTAPGGTCQFLSEGRIERSDWSSITGSVNLSAGVFYYLDPSTAGRLTSTAPSTPGQYVVRIGRAIDTTTLDIEIELPILL